MVLELWREVLLLDADQPVLFGVARDKGVAIAEKLIAHLVEQGSQECGV